MMKLALGQFCRPRASQGGSGHEVQRLTTARAAPFLCTHDADKTVCFSWRTNVRAQCFSPRGSLVFLLEVPRAMAKQTLLRPNGFTATTAAAPRTATRPASRPTTTALRRAATARSRPSRACSSCRHRCCCCCCCACAAGSAARPQSRLPAYAAAAATARRTSSGAAAPGRPCAARRWSASRPKAAGAAGALAAPRCPCA